MTIRIKQRGFALISALIIVGLVTSITITVSVNQSRQIEQITDVVVNTQIKHHAEAIYYWAGGLLIEDKFRNDTDGIGDLWNQALVGVDIEGGEVNAVIEDLQSRFNVNNLALNGSEGDIARERFKRLLQVLDIQTDITDAMSDWIDSDTQLRFPEGAEDDYYLSLDPAYRTANQPMVSTSELLLVKGITKEIYYQLLPYVSTLPIGTKININSAKPEVLLSFSLQMDQSGVDMIESIRTETPFTDIGVLSGDSEDTERESTSSGESTDDPREENDQNSTESLWGSINEKNIGLYENETENNTSKPSSSINVKNPASITPAIDSSSIEKDEVTQQSLSGVSILEQYDINSTGIGVESQYFALFGNVIQHGSRLNVFYKLYRDNSTQSISPNFRVYNGVIYE